MTITKEQPSAAVRRIGLNDTDLLLGFFESLSAASRKTFRPHPFDRATAEKFTGGEALADPAIRRYVAVLMTGGVETAAGYAFFWDWTTDSPSLGIAVGDAYQGMGVGKLLMQSLIGEARSAGKRRIRLNTDKINIRAQALYRQCGFVITGEGVEEDYKLELELSD